MKKIHTVYIAGLFILILGIGATWVINKADQAHQTPPPIIKSVPDFQFKTHDGYTFTMENFRNKITVLDFMFTSCTGPCPIMASNMSRLYEQYRSIPDVQFVSVTVDPDTDTEDVLAAYADANGVNDDRWIFIRSDIKSVKELTRDGFMLFSDDLPAGHSVKFVLIDDKGRIRQYYDGTDKASIAILQAHLNLFLKNLDS
ncbi:MAG TPA: SCO family protein [Candidatus Marinimicrobia bacterium]|nr:SCO family protein [Candidatus Neomarinimicrobiota bacterium]HIB32456.1 SCO family protein [Candidatus Neomarinimicrobiota bacterium]